MKTYEVTIEISLPQQDTYTVEAESEEQAEKLALEMAKEAFSYNTTSDFTIIETEESA